jgi:hypothetical protein
MFVDGLEPENQNAVIWRFMDFEKFRDLMTTSELYFCRADRFCDESEGLPPQEHRHLSRDLFDEQRQNDSTGSIAQFREGFFVNCWHLLSEETARMWKEYGKDGVAVCSRYCLLKSALDSFADRAFLGLVRYGSDHLVRWNVIRFITTKQEKYKHEQEVRALLWIPDQYAGINRHFDENNKAHPRPLTPPPARVPGFHRRKVEIGSLITEVIVSPIASDSVLSEVELLVRKCGYSIKVRPSELTPYKHLLP